MNLQPPYLSSAVPVGSDIYSRTVSEGFEQSSVIRPRADGVPALLRYWRIVVRRRWLVGALVAIALLVGLVGTLLMTPLYTATSTIEISRQQEQIVNVEGVEPKNNGVDLEFYQTHYSLLKSRSLAERVAADLRLASNEDFFETFGISAPDQGFFSEGSSKRLTPAQLEERQDLVIATLLENISISPIRGSRLVNVSFTSPDSLLSQRVTNAWTSHFIASNLDRRFEATSYARKFLEDRLEQLRRRLEESERQLVAYASNQGIINIAAESSSPDAPRQERSLVAEDLAALNQELARATADRIKAGSRSSGLNPTSAEALNNNAIAGLRERSANAASEYSKMLAQFEPGYPPAQALQAQIRQLDQSIAREEGRIGQYLSGNYQEALAREASLKQRVDQLKASLQDLRGRSIQYNIYQRDVDTNRQLYDGLLQRYKEVGIAGGVGTNNISIVDAARLPDRPSSPKLFTNLLLSLLLGVAVAAAIVFILEQIDEAIKDPSEVEPALGLPLLGTVPQVEDMAPSEALRDRKSPVTEAYLSVQTNLQFSTDHGVPRSLAVTSTRASEGKSTSAFAIASSLARTGAKVILVDGDMRSPSVGSVLNLSNDRGISNFLAGDDDLETMVIKAEEFGLHALLAGPPPPNAAELLTGQRLELLIARLNKSFDYVVIDSPPVLGLADAPLISRRVEGVVYAVESHGARASAIRTAIGRLTSANVNLLGVILTKFQPQKASYGYGYEYGYAYGKVEPGAA